MARIALFVTLFLLAVRLDRAWADPDWTRIEPTEEEIKALEKTQWFGVYMADRKVGFARHSATQERVDGLPRLVSELQMRIQMKSLGIEVKMDIVQRMEFEASRPYRLTRLVERESDGEDTSELTITKSTSGFQVERRNGGEVEKKTLADIDHTFGDELAADIWALRKPKLNETIEVPVFSTDKLESVTESHTVLGKKSIRREGVLIEVAEIETFSFEELMKIVSHYDVGTGSLLGGAVGRSFELRSEPEQIARDIKVSVDAFEYGKVKVDKPLGEPDSIEKLVVEAMLKRPIDMPSAPGQSVEKNLDRRLRIILGPPTNIQATPEETREALRETGEFPIRQNSVVELMKMAVGDAKTDADKIQRIVSFVSEFIEPSYTAEPLNVMVLIRERKGDCSEYSALVTTLARAAGVPCRPVYGLVYIADEERRFGGHAWNEAVIDGVWRPIDASQNEMEVDRSHISFGSRWGETLDILGSIEKFRVIEIQRKE